jgi:hypothetical protein
MTKRYYCPQFSDFAKDWIDAAEAFASNNRRVTRVIRKPYEGSHP